MNKDRRKLTLKRTTIARLDDASLRAPAGGMPASFPECTLSCLVCTRYPCLTVTTLP